MPSRIPVLFTLCALVTLTSCVEEPGSEPGQASPPGTPLEIDAAPSLSVGVAAGDTLEIFDRVVTPFVLPALGSAGGIVRYVAAGFGGPEPLSPRSVFASDGTRLYLGDTLEPLIRRVGPAGVPGGEVAWEPTEAVSVQDALEQVIDRAASRASADQRSATRQRLEGAVVSTELSVFWDFLPDGQGFLWVQPYEPLAHAFPLGGTYLGGTAGEGAWRVFTSYGRGVGTIAIPAGLVVTQIGPSTVVGIHRDHLGVESVRVHRLRRK